MTQADREPLAIEQARTGDFTELQLLLLDACEQLRPRVALQIPADLQRLVSTEDVLQDVCVEAIRDIGKFEWRGEGSFQAWLNEIARTCVLDLLRTLRRKKRGGDRAEMRISWLEVAEFVMGVGDKRTLPTPSRIAHSQDVIIAVREAVAQLPDNEHRAMRMYYFDQFPTEAIANELGVTPGAVRAILQRGRHRLQNMLGSSSAWLSHRGWRD